MSLSLKLGGEEISWGQDDLLDFLAQFGVATPDEDGKRRPTVRFSFHEKIPRNMQDEMKVYVYCGLHCTDRKKWAFMLVNCCGQPMLQDLLEALNLYAKACGKTLSFGEISHEGV